VEREAVGHPSHRRALHHSEADEKAELRGTKACGSKRLIEDLTDDARCPPHAEERARVCDFKALQPIETFSAPHPKRCIYTQPEFVQEAAHELANLRLLERRKDVALQRRRVALERTQLDGRLDELQPPFGIVAEGDGRIDGWPSWLACLQEPIAEDVSLLVRQDIHRRKPAESR